MCVDVHAHMYHIEGSIVVGYVLYFINILGQWAISGDLCKKKAN